MGLSLSLQCAMALTISAASLFATALLFVIGRIFIEPKPLVKREAIWFDNNFSFTTVYAKEDTQTQNTSLYFKKARYLL
jgi:hypothetical protein